MINATPISSFRFINFFLPDSRIFGRITLTEGGSLGRGGMGYVVSAEKIFLCAGMEEYTPSYDPQNKKYGCLADEHYLVHRLKVLVSGSW